MKNKSSYNLELTLFRGLTRMLPKMRGAGVIGNKIASFYARKKRKPVTCRVLDFTMVLDPHECVDSSLLFTPQLYDSKETAFLHNNLRPGQVFVDVGANIGFYSLVASNLVGPRGKVISIEAVPDTFSVLSDNISMNEADNVIPLNIGISNRQETLPITVPNGDGLHNNRGGNGFLSNAKGKVVDIPCKPLADSLADCRLAKMDGLKLDVEGFEYRILSSLFSNGNASENHPRFIILEQHPGIEKTEGDSVGLLKENGYAVFSQTRQHNFIMVKNAA